MKGFALAVLMLHAGALPAADYHDDADAWLFVAKHSGLDPAGPLNWNYTIENVPGDELPALKTALRAIGITEMAIPEEDELNDIGFYSLWCEETRAHASVESLATHVERIAAVAKRHGASLESWSVDLREERK